VSNMMDTHENRQSYSYLSQEALLTEVNKCDIVYLLMFITKSKGNCP
jgi:hypothetical protein